MSAFLQAEELGTPLADALVDISSEIRRERAQQVRRAAARAQPKIAMVGTTHDSSGYLDSYTWKHDFDEYCSWNWKLKCITKKFP